MFETKPVNDVIRIAAAGGGFEYDAGTKPVNDIIRIAAAASNGGGQLVLRGCGLKPVNELIRIAAAGRGRVIFVD